VEAFHRQRGLDALCMCSQWEMTNFDPMTSKSPKFIQFDLDVHYYVPELGTTVNFHFNLFSVGFSPDR